MARYFGFGIKGNVQWSRAHVVLADTLVATEADLVVVVVTMEVR